MISDDDVLSLVMEGYTSQQTFCSLCVPRKMLLVKLNDINGRGYNFNLDYVPRADFFRG